MLRRIATKSPTPESSTAAPATGAPVCWRVGYDRTTRSCSVAPTTLRTSIAAGASEPLITARFSTVTAIDCWTVSAVPRETRIVAGPWPRMRSERAPVTLTPAPRS